MPINQNEIVDLLYKKIAFNSAKTDTEASRSPSEEPIASPVSTYGNYIWVAASSIPSIPPPVDSSVVKRYQSSDSEHVQLTRNPDVATHRSWLALGNGATTPIVDWIPPIFGAQYGLKVWIGVPGAVGSYRIYPKGTGSDDQFYFDYNAGTLHFIGNNLPAAIGPGTSIYIEGYIYIGPTDIGALNATTLNDLQDVTIDENTRTLGHVLTWSETQNEWVNGVVPSGSMEDFLISNPLPGHTLVYVSTEDDVSGNPIAVNKFKNKYLYFTNIDGIPATDGGDGGKYLRLNSNATGIEYNTLQDLYSPGWLIEIESSNIDHSEALRPGALTGTVAGQATSITNPDNTFLQSIPEMNNQGPLYATGTELWVMKTTEIDKSGHVLGRVWTNLDSVFDGYVEQSAYDTRWSLHMSGNDARHNIWAHLDGVHASTQSSNARHKLLVKNENDSLTPLAHPKLVISGGVGSETISEIHTTHVSGKPIPDADDGAFVPPADTNILAFSAAQDAWIFTSLGVNTGEANLGNSLASTDANAFDIFDAKDVVTLNFRGIKVYDANNVPITSFSHTWDDGVSEDPQPFPFLAQQTADTIQLKFNPNAIKIYGLSDQLDPAKIGYTIQQLLDWSSATPSIPPPNVRVSNQISTLGQAYDFGWFSNPVDSNIPNGMSKMEWAALMGGPSNIAAADSTGRRLRTSYERHYSHNAPNVPISLQQQIDDKLQYEFFEGHMGLGGQAEVISDPNFGGYYRYPNWDYGNPGTVRTTSGQTNPIFQGTFSAHEAKSIIFRAANISHYGQGAFGDKFHHTNEAIANPGLDWHNHGIAEWTTGAQHYHFHTAKSVITKHINAHTDNPHGVLHTDVESDVAHWNAKQLTGLDVAFNSLSNNDVIVWDGVQFTNSNFLAASGESNQAGNLGDGAEVYSLKVGSELKFRSIKSIDSIAAISVTQNTDTIDIDFDQTVIDIEQLTNWPIDLADLDNCLGSGAVEGNVLTFSGGKWKGAAPTGGGSSDFTYDDTGIDEDYFLTTRPGPDDPITGDPTWDWYVKDKYMIANILAGAEVAGVRGEGNVEIDYDSIENNDILTWSGTNWIAAENAATSGSGEVNTIGSWSDTDLGTDKSSNGVSLAAGIITLADGSTLDVSKRLTRLMVKTIIPSQYISVDTTLSNPREIAFTLDQSALSLGNIGGDLDPIRILPKTVTAGVFGKLEGYTGVNIGDRFLNVENAIEDLQDDKLDITIFEVHTDYDQTQRPGDYAVGYNPAITPGNPLGRSTLSDVHSLKHQPYEIGHHLPVFNADRILNAPIDPTLGMADGSATGLSTLTIDHAGKYMQWDGAQWTIGGGGEVSDGIHQQFAYYYAHTPSVNVNTQILKPTGEAFNFIEGSGTAVESKLGIYTTTPPQVLSISGNSPSIAMKQITDAGNEPDLTAGWGTFYARSAMGGITQESVVVLHFDGADGGNAFLNYGNAELFFLPQSDPDGDGTYDSVNNVTTEADRYIFGGTSGYFPGGPADYLAAPSNGEINLANKPFSFDFWMMPEADTPGAALTGYQHICGQYQQAETYWYVAIDYDSTPHKIEFVWKEWDGAMSSTLHNVFLNRTSSQDFEADTWYHIVFQRLPQGATDRWDLLVAEAPSTHTTGVPATALGYGLNHLYQDVDKVALDIDAYSADFVIGNFCRIHSQAVNVPFDSFKGYIDEFRFQISTYINWQGLANPDGYYQTYLLPYDTGNSALIYKDDLGTYDLLNSAGVVRRLTDQDGDTRLDVDTDDSNDNHIRLITSAIEIASFNQSGMRLSNDHRVTTIKDDLNNSYSTALVTQKAVKEAIENISTSSIIDTVGQTYVHTEASINDYTIRMVVQNDEKLTIDANGLNIKSPLKLSGASPTEGDAILVDANGDLTWGAVVFDNIAAGTEGNVAYYPSAGQALSGSPNFSWDNSDNVLKIKGKQQFHYFDLDTTTILNDTAELRVQLDADGNDANTTVLFHFDTYTMETTSSVDYVGTSAAIAGAQTSHGEDTTIKKFGASSWRSGIYDSNGDLSGPQGNSNSGQAAIGPINLFAISGNTWTHDFWIRPSTSSVTGNTSISNDTVIYQAFKEFGGSWGVYTNQYNDGNASLDEIDLKVDLNNGAMVTIGKLKVKTWQHVALMRNGNTFTAFINGYPIYSDTNAQFEDYGFGQGAVTWPSGWAEVDGAGNANRLSDFFGHIDEFRISTTNRYPETGFAPRGTPYGTNETKFLLESKDNVTVDILEPNSDAVTTEDLLRGNYLVRGQGENPKAVADSNIYALGNSLSIATTRTPSNLNVGGTIGLSNKSESDSDFTESFTSLHAVGVDNVTKALIHCDGNATNYSNTSSDQFVVWHPSSESKFGTGSGNSITLHPSLGYPGNMAFGTQDGTLEFWVRSIDSTVGWTGSWDGREGTFIQFAGDYHGYLTLSLAESNDYMVLSNYTWSNGVNGQYNPSDWTPNISNGETKWAIDGKWHHFCWMREGTFSGFFIDGVLKASKTMSAGQDINSYFWNKWNEGNDPWGGRVGWKQQSNGTLVDELRISVGAARYNITGFTPPSTRVEETLKYTSDEGWDVLLTDLPRRFQNGQLSVPGVKADNLEMEFYTDKADYPSAICNIESAKVFLANENPTPIDEYTTVLFHWDDPQMIANPGGGGTDIAAHWTNSGATGYQYTLTHVNTDNGNNSKHGGYSTTSRFGTNGFLVGWMDNITVDASSELVDALDFGSDDFTIDFWVRHSPWSGNTNTPMGNSNTHYNPSRWFRTDAWTLNTYRTTGPNGLTNTIVFTFTDLPGDSFCFNAPSGVTDYNTSFVWNHWAFVRHGDDFDFYVNGIQFSKGAGGTATSVAGLNMTPISPTGLGIGIGGTWSSAQMVQNVFDEFRISKGIARWTDEFVCQLPYAAYGSMIEVPDVKLAGQYATVSLATDRHLASLATKEQVSLGGSMPVGSVIAFGGSTAPAGWLMTDGSTISRTTYSSLFAVIEDDFGGGDGSTTFELYRSIKMLSSRVRIIIQIFYLFSVKNFKLFGPLNSSVFKA